MFRSDKEDHKSKEEILAEIKQRVEERIQAYSSIQRLHEDIEKCKYLLAVHCYQLVASVHYTVYSRTSMARTGLGP